MAENAKAAQPTAETESHVPAAVVMNLPGWTGSSSSATQYLRSP
jgi:hypothetical protein